jgi:hypothetical protein
MAVIGRIQKYNFHKYQQKTACGFEKLYLVSGKIEIVQ